MLAEYAPSTARRRPGGLGLTVRSFGGGSTAWRIVRRADGIPVMTRRMACSCQRPPACPGRPEGCREREDPPADQGPQRAPPCQPWHPSIGIGKPSLSATPRRSRGDQSRHRAEGAEAGQRIRDSAVEVGRGASAAKRKADDAQEAADAERLANPPKTIREQLGDAIGIRGKSRRK